jgi:hypothetical protein
MFLVDIIQVTEFQSDATCLGNQIDIYKALRRGYPVTSCSLTRPRENTQLLSHTHLQHIHPVLSHWVTRYPTRPLIRSISGRAGGMSGLPL